MMFTVIPTLYKARLDTDLAEAQQVQIEANNTQTLYAKRVVSQQESRWLKPRSPMLKPRSTWPKPKLNFASVRAPFNGIIDRLHQQQGSPG